MKSLAATPRAGEVSHTELVGRAVFSLAVQVLVFTATALHVDVFHDQSPFVDLIAASASIDHTGSGLPEIPRPILNALIPSAIAAFRVGYHLSPLPREYHRRDSVGMHWTSVNGTPSRQIT